MANATKATKSLVGGDKGMFILEPGVLFQRKTNLPANWKKVRIGLVGSFTNLVDANGTPNAEALVNQSNLTNVPIIGMSNGVGYPGTAGNKSVGIRPGWDGEYGSSAETDMAFSSPNWSSSSSGGNYLLADGTTIHTSYPGLQNFHNWRIGDPTANASCMFWFVLELDVTVAGKLGLNWWNSFNTPLSNASDATLMGLISNPAAYAGYSNGGAVLTSAIAWWDALPVDCQFFFARFPYLTNRLRIMNLNIIDSSLYF